MTFFEVYDRWLDKHKADIKQSTVATYYNLCKTFTRILEPDADICSLDADVMKACFERFRDTGASNHYMADLIRVFRMVMRYAGEELGISDLPSIDWKIKDVVTDRVKGATKQRVKRFTIAEYERLIKTFEEHPTPGRLAVVVTMFTGIRVGEACGLKFSDIDFDEGVIHIQRTCVSIGKTIQKMLRPNEEYVRSRCLQSPKSASSDRYIPMIPKLRKILQSYAKVYPGDYFVATLSAEPTCTRTLRIWYGQMLKAANVPYLNYHCLSHSKIFYLLNISELSTLKNVTANDLETSYILFLSQLCNIQRTL